MTANLVVIHVYGLSLLEGESFAVVRESAWQRKIAFRLALSKGLRYADGIWSGSSGYDWKG
jgi:hypothetical protein